MKVELIAVTQPVDGGTSEELLEHAGRVCYRSSKRGEPGKFLANRIREGHTSLIEHASITFEISGISRAASHQLVRHRIASYCLSGDTVVVSFSKKKRRTPKRWTLRQLFEWSGDPKRKGRLKLIRLRSVDDKNLLVPNQIASINYAGTQQTYSVITECGREVRATGKHRFLTPDGWTYLSDLQVGSCVIANGILAHQNEEWLREKYLTQNMMQKEIARLCGVSVSCIRNWVTKFNLHKPRSMYPNRQPGYGVPGMFSDEDRIRISERMSGSNNPQWSGDRASFIAGRARARKMYAAEACEYCGTTSALLRHHIDRNPMNNSPRNIRVLCEPCHKAIHVGQAVIAVYSVPIISIRPWGIEETYDLTMANPPYNFVANGLVVHNSQESQRYVLMDDPKFVMPPSVAENIAAEVIWSWLMEKVVETYDTLRVLGIRKEDCRFVLPNATVTRIVVTMNFRSLRHFFSVRCDKAAQWEIRAMATEMLRLAHREAPAVFQDLYEQFVER